MPTEISLSRKVGVDLINIKTDLEPEAAVGFFADLVTLMATANEVGQLPGQPAPQVSVQQAAQNVQQGLGGQYIPPQPAPQHTDPRAPGYAQGPPPFDGGVPAKVCDHGKMVRFDGVSKKNGQAYVRWDCPAGQKPCVKWGN
jgi:hypothetical protein